MVKELFAISEFEKMVAYLMIARDMERYATEYYFTLATLSDDPLVRSIAREIAMDEVDHTFSVGSLYGQVRAKVEHMDYDRGYYEDLKHVSWVFPPLDDKDYDILSFFDIALLVEKKAMEYYATPLTIGVDYEPLRKVLENLKSIEESHLNKVRDLKNHILRVDERV